MIFKPEEEEKSIDREIDRDYYEDDYPNQEQEESSPRDASGQGELLTKKKKKSQMLYKKFL